MMLFRVLEDGTLPNGQRSRLRGCRVSANSYGDISSERALPHSIVCLALIQANPLLTRKLQAGCFSMARWVLKGNH
ncbi:hypothetical protein PGH45_20040 [Legionella pneumophila]|nr:hypothetical protein [Legionella pneumophila]